MTLRVYIDSGAVFEVTANSLAEAAMIAQTIAQYGYRADAANGFVYYPAHRVERIEASGQ